jgi:hypothetical protein
MQSDNLTDKEKIDYLIEALKTVSNAIDNEAPSMALWEVRRVMQTIDSWNE